MKKFIDDLFKEAEGKWSLSRAMTALCVLAVVGLLIADFVKNGHVPDMTSGAAFITAAGVGHYGVGKVMAYLSGKGDKDQQ